MAYAFELQNPLGKKRVVPGERVLPSLPTRTGSIWVLFNPIRGIIFRIVGIMRVILIREIWIPARSDSHVDRWPMDLCYSLAPSFLRARTPSNTEVKAVCDCVFLILLDYRWLLIFDCSFRIHDSYSHSSWVVTSWSVFLSVYVVNPYCCIVIVASLSCLPVSFRSPDSDRRLGPTFDARMRQASHYQSVSIISEISHAKLADMHRKA